MILGWLSRLGVIDNWLYVSYYESFSYYQIDFYHEVIYSMWFILLNFDSKFLNVKNEVVLTFFTSCVLIITTKRLKAIENL